MGWQIVRHSFLLLFRNFRDALRVSVGPILLGLVFAIVMVVILGLSVDQIVADMTDGTASPALVLAAILGLVAFVFVSGWIAVAWHRFVLLEEYPGLLPAIAGRPIWAYAGRSFLLGFILLLALIPGAVVASVLVQVFGQSAGVLLLVGFALAVYLTWVWLRIAVVLPATAVGNQTGITAGWAATAPIAAPILAASAILVTMNLVVSQILGVLADGVLVTILDIATSWLTLMIGTSVLTTIYGVAFEKRALPV